MRGLNRPLFIILSMNKSKLKILMCSEASFLSSGFSTYAREILSRLHATNKYEIAEFASYGMVNDPRDKDIPWKYYANAVKDNDPRHKEYNSRTDNQFGRWRFEKVLLDFRPDVCIDVRDYWMSSYQALSPLRKYFHWILMPTVDSAPQQEEWIDTFLSADAIFTYSDWGAEVLRKQSSGKINYINTTSPGVDLQVFKPLDNQKEIKNRLGLPIDSIILGSVMRNQKRKLFPELMISFRKTLDILETENYALGQKLYLYLHTSYPDMGWDLPELLKENRILNRVFFTYACRKCSHIDSSTYVGPARICPKCLNKTMMMPSVTTGISNDKLSEIYNIFDLYIQYALCEGFGMPQVEAAACGVPLVAINYSAMVDIINKLEAIAIEPKTYFKELETKAIRTYPDNDQLAHEIINFLSQSPEVVRKQKIKTRYLTEKYYDWNIISKIWENYLDKLSETYRANWDTPPQYILQKIDTDNISEEDLFLSLTNFYTEILKDRNKISSMSFLSALQCADYSFSANGANVQPYNYGNIIENLQTEIDNINRSEEARYNKVKFNDDFIQYAHIKSNIK